MAKQTFHIEGLRELDRALSELPKATGRNALKRALIKAVEPMEADAERFSPKLTGKLEKSIIIGTKLSRRQKSMHKKESEVEIFMGPGPHPKGVQQEFGNAHNGAQPFMRPAFDGNVMGALNSIKSDLAAEIEKARKRLARKAEREAAKMMAGA